MTSSVETHASLPGAADREPRRSLLEVMLAERAAYETMRALVPDLALPRERRGPLTARQLAAIDAYHELRDRLEALRGATRSLAVATPDDQSL